jgi:thiamine biosynthesis lipoprotein
VTTPYQLVNAPGPDRAALSRREFWRPRPAGTTTWLRVFRQAMACRFEVLVPANRPGEVDAARAALTHAERIEAAWSVFRPDSDLSRINRDAADGPAEVDAELRALLDRCLALTAATEGAFDITATPLSRCWRWLDRAGAVPAADALAEARARVGAHLIAFDAAGPAPGGSVRFARPGVELNLGAIGKGYAVGRVAAALAGAGVGTALVSAGDSSVEAVGAPRGGWEIALRGSSARLWLTSGALGTSGASEQGILVGGVRLGHVLDPRTGWPAAGVSRVTVATADAADADALSTALLIGGPALAERVLADRDDVLAVFTLDGSARPRIMGRAHGAVVEVQR